MTAERPSTESADDELPEAVEAAIGKLCEAQIGAGQLLANTLLMHGIAGIDAFNSSAQSKACFDAYAELKAALAAERVLAQARWIPVEERLPEDESEVLVWIESMPGLGYVGIDAWRMYREDPICMSTTHTIDMGYAWRGNDPSDVTHWQPMPRPPKE